MSQLIGSKEDRFDENLSGFFFVFAVSGRRKKGGRGM